LIAIPRTNVEQNRAIVPAIAIIPPAFPGSGKVT